MLIFQSSNGVIGSCKIPASHREASSMVTLTERAPFCRMGFLSDMEHSSARMQSHTIQPDAQLLAKTWMQVLMVQRTHQG